MAKDTRWTGAVSRQWTDAENWTNGVPVATDTIYIGEAQNGIDPEDASGATFASVTIYDTFTHTIGGAGKDEYLQIDATLLDIGKRQYTTKGAGSPLIKINTGTVNCTGFVYSTYTGATPKNKPAVQLLANAGNTTFRIMDGFVGFATDDPEDTCSVLSIHVGQPGNQGQPRVICGIGCTVTSGTVISSGTFEMQGLYSTADLYMIGGSTVLDTTSDIATVTMVGGKLFADNHGTITTLEADGGTVDWTRTIKSRTVTGCTTEPIGGRVATLILDTTYVSLGTGIDPQVPVIISAVAA